MDLSRLFCRYRPGGGWRIEAKVTGPGAAFRVAMATSPEGPWKAAGGFSGREDAAALPFAAGGPLELPNDADSVWLRLRAEGQHEPGERLEIHDLRFRAGLAASPFATGDARPHGWGPTDLAVYGGAYIGYLAALEPRWITDKILAFTVSGTDFFARDATRTVLYHNRSQEAVTFASEAGGTLSLGPGTSILEEQ